MVVNDGDFHPMVQDPNPYKNQQKNAHIQVNNSFHTVDGRNPAPVDMVNINIPVFPGFHDMLGGFLAGFLEPSTVRGSQESKKQTAFMEGILRL